MTNVTEETLSERLAPIVLGGDVLAYSYARCFHEAYGVKTIVYSSVEVKVTASSRFVDYRVHPALGEGEEAITELLRELGESLEKEGKIAILLGSADWHVRIISHNKDELKRWFVIPYNDFSLLDEITQKGRFYEFCEELDMPYPRTWLVDCSLPESPIDPTTLPYPLVAKPSNSARYDLMDFPGKEKVYEIDSAEELKRVFQLLHDAGYDYDLVIQDFVPGEDDALYTLTTYSDSSGRVVAVSGGRVVLQDHSPARIGNPVCILLERNTQLLEGACRFCEQVGYRGFANFDAKYDSRDGTYKFFEVNVRPGANTWYMSLGGVNFATLIVDDFVLGKKLAYREAYKDALFTLVPPCVIRDFVGDDDLRQHALNLFKEGKAASPYDYAPDTLAHHFWAKAKSMHQYNKFKQYYHKVAREN